MVSNYKRKTDKASYSKETLRNAVRAVKNGDLSGYRASQMFKIPRMTIMDHVNNKRFKSNTLGRTTALSIEIETKLASCLHQMEKYGFGLSKKEVLEMVGQYVLRNELSTPFKNGTPGNAWFSAFKERHHLSVKKPQAVEYARKKAMNPFIIYPYFDLLQKTLIDLNLLERPSAIWNLDETSFSKDPEKTKIVGVKGHAATRVISSPGRDNVTVLLGANALGEKAPPLIIFKGKYIWDEWTSPDAYPGTSYAATKKGWMETEVFEMYFKKTFLPAVGNQRPILLVYDGHATHVGLNIIEEARKTGVTILKLPPHTSHVLQPLDIAVMKSFKDHWDPLLVKWQRLNVGATLPKKEFSRLIGLVWQQIDSEVLRNGFRKAGIFPFNREVIEEKQFDSLKLKQWKELQILKSREGSKNISPYIHSTLEGSILFDDKLASITTKYKVKSLLSLAFNCITKVARIEPSDGSNDQRYSVYWDTNNFIMRGHVKQNIPSNISPSASCSHATNIKHVQTPLENKQVKDCRQEQEPDPSVSFNKDLTRHVNSSKKIHVLEDRMISFEELLLMQVKAGNNLKIKRQKIAPGAEVITHDDVLNRKMKENINNIKKKPTTRKITTNTQNSKLSIQSKKTNSLNIKGKQITQRKTSCSNHSTSDVTSDNVSDPENDNDDSPLQSQKYMISDVNVSPGPSRSMEKTINRQRRKIVTNTTKKGKGIGKESRVNENESLQKKKHKAGVKKRAKRISMDSTSISDCVSLHSDSDIIECDEIEENILTPEETIEPQNESGSAAIENEFCELELENGEDEEYLKDVALEQNLLEDYRINDHVLVRYYNRRKWTYYVGCIEKVKPGDEMCYTIKFFKTVKKPLKFVVSKKVDRDEVPKLSVVKKVVLSPVPDNPKELLLSNDNDAIYFS